MRLLWIATKAPVPPVDGGRLVALFTLEALAEQGVDVTLVAPVEPGSTVAELEAALAPFCRPRLVPAAPRRPLGSAARSLLSGRPYAIERHTLQELRSEVDRLVATQRFDAVHAEQLQAFAQAGPALSAELPVVLRAQNVESDLWRATARLHRWAGPWLAREARRLARYEGEAVRRASVTVALTERDAERLRSLAGDGARVVAVPPPFPAELPAGELPLPGDPSLVLLGSGGWLPNRDAARWFLEEVWPVVYARVPGAVLHLFAAEPERPGALPPGVELHAPPATSRDAFAPGSILVVPLRIASGIRMKVLEAWARGVPVVASPEAAAGLEAEDGRELLLCRDAGELAAALERLGASGTLRTQLVASGRWALARRFHPATVAATLVRTYRSLTPPPRPPAPR